MLAGKRILLIIGGGVAAFKSLTLIRILRERGASVVPVSAVVMMSANKRSTRCWPRWTASTAPSP